MSSLHISVIYDPMSPEYPYRHRRKCTYLWNLGLSLTDVVVELLTALNPLRRITAISFNHLSFFFSGGRHSSVIIAWLAVSWNRQTVTEHWTPGADDFLCTVIIIFSYVTHFGRCCFYRLKIYERREWCRRKIYYRPTVHIDHRLQSLKCSR